MSADYSTYVDENARLIILKALAMEINGSMNDSLLGHQLERFGISKPRSYLRNQMRWLENTAGAVRITEAGTALIATLTRTGRDHVERRLVLEGVQRPGDPE
nr:hypothetical protein [Brucella anthropi]